MNNLSVTSRVFGLLSRQDSIPARRPVFTIEGDLNQMALQQELLDGHGIATGNAGVYPVLYEEGQVTQALTLIWNSKVDGWWHYKAKYVEHKVCTAEEFHQALERQCAADRRSQDRRSYLR